MEKHDEHPQSFISPGSEYGLLRAATPDRTVWLYGEIPWTDALLDGADNDARIAASNQLQYFFDGLASLVPVAGMKYRDMLKAFYREFHLFTSGIPTGYRVPRQLLHTDLGAYLADYYGDVHQRRQFAVIGVPLNTGGKSSHRKETLMQRAMRGLNNLAYTIGNHFNPFENYLKDAETIAGIMRNAGIIPFMDMSEHHRARLVSMMESWWINRPSSSGLPIIAEYDHLHFFPNTDLAQHAKTMYDDGVDCKHWNIRDEYPATMCFAKTSGLDELPVDSPSGLWIAQLMSVSMSGGANAVGVSVRGKVEPAKVTADQLRRNARTIDANINEREKKNREATGDLIEKAEELAQNKAEYRFDEMPATVIDTSIAVCVAGNAEIAIEDLSRVQNFEFVNMNTASEQLMAFKSMQPCSPIRMTPYEMHLTVPAISGGGVSSLATAGDDYGALVGMTEANRQPVYIGTTTASDREKKPAILVIGDTGSGKSMLLVSLALQWAQMDTESGYKTPVVLFNPKEGNDFEDATQAVGGRIIRLDKDVSAGALDPFNVTASPEEAKDNAVRMISDIVQANGGSAEAEIAVAAMITYGMRHGAKCCGTMLQCAYQAWRNMKQQGIDPASTDDPLPPNTEEVYQQIGLALRSYQQLRLIFGIRDDVPSLRLSEGMTLINAGDRNLIPEEGAENTVTGRIQQWVMTMTILGMGSAMVNRDGVVIVDEAWAVLRKGSKTADIITKWMRLARSQRYMPVLASQKVREFIDADLTGGFSRAFLLAMSDSGDPESSPARLALKLLQIKDEYGVILRRMKTAPLIGHKSSVDDDGKATPNPDSLGALIDPETRVVKRGSVAYFLDGDRKPVPVEVIIPAAVLKDISTNRRDKLRREHERANHRGTL